MTVPMVTARTTKDTYSAYLWQCLSLQLVFVSDRLLKTLTVPIYDSANAYSSCLSVIDDLRPLQCLTMTVPMVTARVCQ